MYHFTQTVLVRAALVYHDISDLPTSLVETGWEHVVMYHGRPALAEKELHTRLLFWRDTLLGDEQAHRPLAAGLFAATLLAFQPASLAVRDAVAREPHRNVNIEQPFDLPTLRGDCCR